MALANHVTSFIFMTMADDGKQKRSRGRPSLTESERKRRKAHRRTSLKQTTITLGSEFDRWQKIKADNTLKSDREVATFLIDNYRHGLDQPGPSVAGPSVALQDRLRLPWIDRLISTPVTQKVTTSTPVSHYSQNIGPVSVRTPSVSGVSEQESSDREIEVMSGVEEIQSEVDIQASKPLKSRRPLGTKQLSSSFMDPFDVTIQTSRFEPEDETDLDDPDYEPSFEICPLLDDDTVEDLAFEEVEFGLEVPLVDEEEGAETNVVVEGVARVNIETAERDVVQATKCVVFLSQLKQLILMQTDCCRTCGRPNGEMAESFIGSAVYFKWTCEEGHETRWCSQPAMNRMLHAGDFQICSTILTSGNNYGKMNLWARFLHLKFPSADQFHKIQSHYLVPTIDTFWYNLQNETVQEFAAADVVVLGDGRNDTPGHSAQYCSYTMMEMSTKKILTLRTLDKRMTERKSGNMEKVGFKAAMEELSEKGLTITEVVTDAHLGIGALMKTDYTEMKHSHDIWHVAKNLGKKLSKIAQKKENNKLQKWNADIINHFWFSCKTASTYGQFVGIWRSVLHHIVNKHTWMVPHGEDGITECLHEPINEETRNKPWLHPKNDANCIKALAAIILNKRLLNNVGYYLNFRSTADLEGFHQHILLYCAKRFAYSPPVYRVRNLLAAIDHNKHVDRPTMINKNGKERLARVWNKKSARWSAHVVKQQKSYGYMDELLTQAVNMRLEDRIGMSRPRIMEADDPRRIAKHLAPVSPAPTASIFQEQKTRFEH